MIQNVFSLLQDGSTITQVMVIAMIIISQVLESQLLCVQLC